MKQEIKLLKVIYIPAAIFLYSCILASILYLEIVVLDSLKETDLWKYLCGIIAITVLIGSIHIVNRFKSRWTVVSFITIYLSIVPILSILFLGALSKVTDPFESLEKLVLSLVMIYIIMYIIIATTYLKSKVELKLGDIKVAINICNAIFTILFTVLSSIIYKYYDLVFFIFIIPFSINLLSNGILEYIETNKNDACEHQ